MNEPDVIAALVQLLKNDAGVAAQVDVRVFGDELPRDEVAAMPRRGVIVRLSGGVEIQGGYVELTAERIDVISWGETPHRAAQVSLAVRAALKRLRRQVVDVGGTGVLVHSAEEAGGRLSIRDAETDWPAVTQAFQILYALKATA